jgi:transposase-like protein
MLARVIKGEASGGAGELRGLLVKLGAQRVLQELLEAEQREFLAADRYERSGERKGRRNGYEPLAVDTAEGRLDLWAPQVRDGEEPFQSRLLAFLRGRTEVMERLVTEMYVHGLSTRDIEAAFTDATGGCILSRSVVSEVTERLWQEYRAFRERDLSDLEVEYLFADGLYESLRRMGRRKEAVLCLWAICADGRKVLLDVVVGNRESMEAWLDCLRGLVARSLRPPVLMTSDGAPGLVAALEQVFPQALRQRCLAHKARNVLGKVSAQDHAQVKADVQSAYYASSQEVARLVATQVVEKWQKVCPSAMASFQEDFEACIAYLRCPANHHRYIRTTNLAERSIEEERRRSKVIPRFFDEKSALKICFSSLLRASRRWQRVRITDWDRLHLDRLRRELYDQEEKRRYDPLGSELIQQEVA